MSYIDWRGVERPNEGTMFYVRVAAPISIDSLFPPGGPAPKKRA